MPTVPDAPARKASTAKLRSSGGPAPRATTTTTTKGSEPTCEITSTVRTAKRRLFSPAPKSARPHARLEARARPMASTSEA